MSYPPYEPPQGPPYGSEPYGGQPLYQAPRPTNGLAIASLVTSGIAVAGAFVCCVPGLLGIVGAVLGHVAQGQIRANGDQGGALALAGIIVGWSSAVLTVLVFVVIAVFFAHSWDAIRDGYNSV